MKRKAGGGKAEEVPLGGGGVACQEPKGAVLNEQKNQQVF